MCPFTKKELFLIFPNNLIKCEQKWKLHQLAWKHIGRQYGYQLASTGKISAFSEKFHFFSKETLYQKTVYVVIMIYHHEGLMHFCVR